MPKRLFKTKKRAGITMVLIFLAVYTLLGVFNKFLNAIWMYENGFQMASYHPATFWISIIAGLLWFAAAWIRKLGIWWYVPGILGVIYAVYMLLGGIIYGGWLI